MSSMGTTGDFDASLSKDLKIGFTAAAAAAGDDGALRGASSSDDSESDGEPYAKDFTSTDGRYASWSKDLNNGFTAAAGGDVDGAFRGASSSFEDSVAEE